MIDIRTSLQSCLSAIATRVYFRKAIEGATFPYVVYNIIQSSDGGEHDSICSIDVDGWDVPATGDTTVLETLMDALQVGLNKKTIITSDFAISLFMTSRFAVDDDDTRIERRKLIFEARLIERSI